MKDLRKDYVEVEVIGSTHPHFDKWVKDSIALGGDGKFYLNIRPDEDDDQEEVLYIATNINGKRVDIVCTSIIYNIIKVAKNVFKVKTFNNVYTFSRPIPRKH